MKRIVSLITALVLFITSAAVFPAYAAENSHVIINQVYGASDNGYADHSFIELYNPTGAAVDLNGWPVQYRSSKEGDHAGSAPVIPEPVYTPVRTSDKQYAGFFNDTSAVRAKLIARYNSGAQSADGGSAEITAYNPVNRFAYSVNGVKGTLDCIDMRNLENGATVAALAGTQLKAAQLAENTGSGFVYGDLTSVAVSPDGKTLAAAMQDADYTKSGCVLFFDCHEDGSLTYSGMAVTGVQPDMVVFSEDGTTVLTADEGEPRQGYTAPDAVDPKGSVTVIDAATKNAVTVTFDSFDARRDQMVNAGVVLKKNTAPSVDLEPEYIAVSGDMAYVALQEANAVAVLNIRTRQIESIFSLGFEGHSIVAIDLNKSDGVYAPETYDKIKGIRMPDGISAVTMNGQTYLLTANEGDSRAWPADIETDVNEIKDKVSPVNGIRTGGKVTWFDVSQYDGLEAGTDYVFGGRSFTLFRVTDTGLEEVYDSGSDFERITAQVLPEYFNCSNDTVEVEDRSGKKGPEPENVTVGTVNGRTYAFVGLERIGGVMIYDITDPSAVTFRNYVNSRNYSADIYDDVSPEGVIFVAAEQNSSGAPLVIASNEVSGTVSVTALDMDAPAEDDPGKPQPPKDEPPQPSGDEPKQNEPASPKTGGEASPVLWTAVIPATGAAMLGMAVCGRKQKRIRAK